MRGNSAVKEVNLLPLAIDMPRNLPLLKHVDALEHSLALWALADLLPELQSGTTKGAVERFGPGLVEAVHVAVVQHVAQGAGSPPKMLLG
eukprot:14367506-Alexandrium_andersonii.AAC.1